LVIISHIYISQCKLLLLLLSLLWKILIVIQYKTCKIDGQRATNKQKAGLSDIVTSWTENNGYFKVHMRSGIQAYMNKCLGKCFLKNPCLMQSTYFWNVLECSRFNLKYLIFNLQSFRHHKYHLQSYIMALGSFLL
jgi:hypothetical protein